MKTWKEFAENNRPSVGPLSDRSLETFRSLLDQMQMATRSILDPEAKQEVGQLVNRFREEMRTTLLKYKAKGIGYSPRYEPNPAPWSGKVH